jgi:hypothetical protein
MNGKKAKRLQPKSETLRKTIPDLGQPLRVFRLPLTDDECEGDFIGQLCHIAAAEEGGQRFDSTMINEATCVRKVDAHVLSAPQRNG